MLDFVGIVLAGNFLTFTTDIETSLNEKVTVKVYNSNAIMFQMS